MLRYALRSFPVIAALALLGAPALRAQGAAPAADDRPTVAVMHFNNGAIGKEHEELDPLRAGIADILTSELSANPGIRVIERDQLDKLVAEQKLGTSGSVDAATAARVGKLLGVHHMIFGSYVTDRKGRMRLDARAVDVETGRIEHVESVQAKTDDFSDMITSLAAKLNSGLKLPPMPARTASARPVPKPPFQVVMLYSRAIAEENGGRPQEAKKLYRAALEKFPDYAPARKALDRIDAPKRGT
ncbi:MAG: tetratricopeptide repeat protein [Gemmatimonadaceae bacterium]|nr:tetratricopeptide repeat protein [Gemmatimonadaceae bacterium]